LNETPIDELPGNANQPRATAKIAPKSPKGQKLEFLHRLESLRGIAAFMVAGQHSFMIFSVGNWQDIVSKLATIPFNGSAAVSLFFVLSGLVLRGSLIRGKGPFLLNYTTFTLRRVFRIYPAFIVAAFLIIGTTLFVVPDVHYSSCISNWFTNQFDATITGGLILKNLLLLDHALNPPSWTLRVELVCSFALPLLYLTLKTNWWFRGVLLLGLLAWRKLGYGVVGENLFMFYLGLLMPETEGYFRKAFARLKSLAKWVAPILWLALCSEIIVFQNRIRTGCLLEGVTSALFIATLLYGPELKIFKVLDTKPTRFLGRISYSFYLYHMFCLYFIARIAFHMGWMDFMGMYAIASSTLLLIGSTGVALLVAWLSYKFIEQPTISLSKNICIILEKRYLR
jgi:peptidoglycan/LPS O-acetylase OafA/YrhL